MFNRIRGAAEKLSRDSQCFLSLAKNLIYL
jgi:hypothetical protein